MASPKLLPKIAILGAGPSGLTLASLLNKSLPSMSHNIKIFELRSKPSPTALETPSGSLDLHNKTGLLAIEKMGLTSKFKTMLSDCSEEMIIADKYGKVRFHDEGLESNRPEISRNALTSLLLSTVPQNIIRWDTKALSVTPGSERKWKVAFGKDEQEEFDFVVGADGAWSKARDALPGTAKPSYSGLSYLTFTIPQLTANYPSLARMVGGGSYSASGPFRSIVSQRAVQDSRRMYLMLSIPASYFSDTGIDTLSPAKLKEKLLGEDDLYGGFGKDLKDLIAAGCDAEKEAVEARPLYTLPIGHKWTHTPGLTLIGDAAHVTTPSGEGVNVGMLDALELSEAITATSSLEDEGKLDEAVKAFEEKMWERGKEVAKDAEEMKEMMWQDPNAPEGFLKFMQSHAEKAHA
jgi:2-polyprenyl-6-methoxyphenol hydroxylase-like FAD-dependent oxidoreductase